MFIEDYEGLEEKVHMDHRNYLGNIHRGISIALQRQQAQILRKPGPWPPKKYGGSRLRRALHPEHAMTMTSSVNHKVLVN